MKNYQKGFTLVEAVVGTALFVIIALAAYQAYFSLFTLAALNQYKIVAIELADEQFEIVRNMPYNNIGVVNGIPAGVIPQTQTLTRGGIPFTVTTIVRNVDLPFDGLAGSSTNPDTSPADNKLVALTITCPTCKNFAPLTLTTQVAPKNLETASTNGVLLIKTYDANGNPVQDASVNVVNNQVTPSTIVNDTTNDSGILEIVDAATGTNAYNITVTKSGYSTDRTYPASSTNPTPKTPYATVLLQQVTPISFSIDKLSTLAVSSVTSSCSAVPNVGFTIAGAKTIDSAGLIPKYSATTSTDSTGNLTLNNMEWDSYTFGLNSVSYDLAGLNLLNPVPLNPNTTQNVLLVVTPKTPKSLLVTVKDSATLLPLTNATVMLSNGSGYSSTQTTGQGFFDQTDWSGGSGQANYSASTSNQYQTDSGGVDVTSTPGDIKLLKVSGSYVSSASLESSTFDTGSASHFHSLIWQPGSQPVGAGANSVTLQIASNATNTATTTWTYLGPDGTSGSYYTSSNSTIGTMHDGDRYLRYKLFLNTLSSTTTPDVSDVAFTFTTACTPPGQVIFQGLSSGTYNLSVSDSGYTTSTTSVNVSPSWQEQPVILGP
jgi:prepilin-type N-terminal cleavage/methylation domain-containing protein